MRRLSVAVLLLLCLAVLPGGAAADETTSVSIAADSSSVTEGTSATFTVTRSGDLLLPSTVTYTTEDGSASAGSDYTAQSGTLEFLTDETTKTITVATAGNGVDEPNETFGVRLTEPTVNTSIGTAAATVTINDDDALPTVSISGAPTPTEGSPATFSVSLSAAYPEPVTVNWGTHAGSATAGSDFTHTGGTITFAPGETGPKPIDVSTINDSIDEDNETFSVQLTGANNATIGTGSATATIQDGDDPPAIASISDPVVTEGNSGTTNAGFVVTLSGPSGKNVSVQFATAEGSANADDFVGASGTLTIGAGSTSGTINVAVKGDTIPEADEFFFVNLFGGNASSIADPQGRATIVNDDAAPTVTSIGDATVTEGNSGTVNADFLVTLSGNAPTPVAIRYSTTSGSASSPSDYIGVSNAILTIPAGSSQGTITIQVNGDTLPEGSGDPRSENFFVDLLSATGATLGSDTRGVGTITDDDVPPTVTSIGDATVTEGNSATVAANFVVTLSGNAPTPVAIRYTTTPGSASSPSDYVAAGANATLTIPAGQSTGTITIQVNGDTLSEGSGEPRSENFFVDLVGTTGATLGTDTRGIGTIIDEDVPPSITILAARVTEGDGGTVSLDFKVKLSAATAQQVQVTASTQDGSAVAGADYQVRTQVLVWTPNTTQLEKTFSVNVTGDALDEPDETMLVRLTDPQPQGVTIAVASATGTIDDNDNRSMLAVSDAEANEGATGTTSTMTFKVSLAPASARAVRVGFATASGTAVVGSDYNAANGTLDFAPGETSKDVVVTVLGDDVNEDNETVLVNLAGATGARVGDAQGQGTIVDKNAPPSLSIDDPFARESEGATFTVTLAGTTLRTVTVSFGTGDGTAREGSDYSPRSGTLTFAPGEKTKAVAVTVLDDTVPEGAETFVVTLGNVVNGALTKSRGTATIEASDQVTTAGGPRPTPPTTNNLPPVKKPTTANAKVVFPEMVLGPRSLTLTSVGRARMQMTCAKTSKVTCAGQVSLENAGKPKLVLGKRSFSVKKGKQVYIPVTLTDRGFALVQKRVTLKVRAVVFVKAGGKMYRIVPGVIVVNATKKPEPRVQVSPIK